MGSRRMISEQPSHHSMGGQGQGHGSHLHHNSQGPGQGQGPSDLNSRDSSTIAGSGNTTSNNTPNQPTLPTPPLRYFLNPHSRIHPKKTPSKPPLEPKLSTRNSCRWCQRILPRSQQSFSYRICGAMGRK